MSNYRISVIAGDGIGPEQTEAAIRVLHRIEEVFHTKLDFVEAEAGDACQKECGNPLQTKRFKR